jgi:hypothetical protein
VDLPLVPPSCVVLLTVTWCVLPFRDKPVVREYVRVRDTEEGHMRVMSWVRLVIGAIAVLVGLLWIGQGLNLIGGSSMSGHGGYAVLGIIVVAMGAWLLWSGLRNRAQARAAS